MRNYSTVLSDLLRVVPRHRITKRVAEAGTDYRVRSLSTVQLLKTMLFGQIANAFSLREIESAMQVHRRRLYHSGMAPVKRSTLSDAMAKRNAGVFEAIYNDLLVLVGQHTRSTRRRFRNPLRAVDSTTIPLSLERFNWAKFRRTKGAVKLHVAYDVDTAVAEHVIIDRGSSSDITVHPRISHENDIHVLDRGYLSFKALYQKHIDEKLFVIRLKEHVNWLPVSPHSQSDSPAIRGDWQARLQNPRRHSDYPAPVRIVQYRDLETGKDFLFMTNVWDLTAQQIADIYKARWQVELFFKWIKQNLKITTFWGTSRNAVHMQIWVALILYLLVWLHRSMLAGTYSMQRLLQMIRTALLHRSTISEIAAASGAPPPVPDLQPDLFARPEP